LKDREEAILDFQLRVLDLVSLDSTPIVEKIKFVKIVISNIEEFIAIRIPEKDNQEDVDHLIRITTNIFRFIDNIIRDLNEKYDIEPIELENDIFKKIFHKDFRYIYSGENDIVVNKELNEIISSVKENGGTYTALYTDGTLEYDPMRTGEIKVSPEIILIDAYVKKYQDKYENEIYHVYQWYERIDNFYERFTSMKFELYIRNPRDSYQFVLDLIDQLCTTPMITTIFITLYRIAKNSKIVESLLKAKKFGKDVFVYTEITARGDEYHNICNAHRLEEAGVHVKTNYFNYKVHAKMFLAIDKNGKKIAHIGTGNYNEVTARQYTDTHIMTSDPMITNEISNIMTALFEKKVYKPELKNKSTSIFSSPTNFRPTINSLIDREIEKGYCGRIWIKCNNLCDRDVIAKLYSAGEVGVDVRIICRTGCAMLPAKNVVIRSKVGLYLEHDRLYIFGDDEFISSADLLFRNISKRLEIMCRMKYNYVSQEFEKVWYSENIHELQPDGSWELIYRQ
jgi:polyphosphate kinase 1